MTSLQTATDIVALVFMGTIILFVFVLMSAILVTIKKINKVQDSVQDKIDVIRAIPYIGRRVLKSIKR